MDSATAIVLDCFFSYLVGLLLCFIQTPVFHANSVDPVQMLSSVESDLYLHCLAMSLLWDTRHNYRLNDMKVIKNHVQE